MMYCRFARLKLSIERMMLLTAVKVVGSKTAQQQTPKIKLLIGQAGITPD